MQSNNQQMDENLERQAASSLPEKNRLVYVIVSVVSLVALSLYTLPTGIYHYPRPMYVIIHLGIMVFIVSFLEFQDYWQERGETSSRLAKLLRPTMVLYMAIAVLATLYLTIEYEALVRERLVNYTTLDLIVGGAMIAVVVHLSFRRFGKIIGGIIVGSIIYAYFGPLFPGLLYHGGLSLSRIIPTLSLEFSGLYGDVMQIVGIWVFIFVLYAGVLEAFGSIDLFVRAGRLVSVRSKHGVPQVGVIASAIMGSLMGSSMANTAVTGSFTIPLMKEHGVDRRTAAAIEAVASSGGQVLPPVMASVAFIIAARVGIPYGDVVLAAILPVMLLYITFMISIFLFTREDDLVVTPETDEDLRVFTRAFPLILSIAILTYLLVVQRLSPGRAGLYTIAAFVVSVFAADLVKRPGIGTIKENTKLVLEGVTLGTLKMAPLSVLVAGLVIVLEILGTTGLGTKLALEILNFTGESLLLTALLVMTLSIILGLGMPSIAAYLFAATLSVPPMLELGIDPLIAHFFIFYYAVLSGITPPVALVVAVSSKIADADFLKSAIRTVVLGFSAFVIPFLYLYFPELMLWEYPRTVYVFGLSLAGLIVAALVINFGYIKGGDRFRLLYNRYHPTKE